MNLIKRCKSCDSLFSKTEGYNLSKDFIRGEIIC